ncbi:hypothetical protein EDC14_1001121 [Hydrogenispora ethanolica]|uniref:Uncharacterized protein n=1 Tax=Hydrogenispora ethanolica TaxID=1082276 RepID=A0A4R1SBH3_HYDET|nr:hypothetical protein EDC14_1001121 [Hydrogenispora ethanolica]
MLPSLLNFKLLPFEAALTPAQKNCADPLPSRAGRGFWERIGEDNGLRHPSPGSGREKGRG